MSTHASHVIYGRDAIDPALQEAEVDHDGDSDAQSHGTPVTLPSVYPPHEYPAASYHPLPTHSAHYADPGQSGHHPYYTQPPTYREYRRYSAPYPTPSYYTQPPQYAAYGKQPEYVESAASYPVHPAYMYVEWTDDYNTKLSDTVRRRCHNCGAWETSTWRRSTLAPGKILCNKCGLFERSHRRKRPAQLPQLKSRLSKASIATDGPPEAASSTSTEVPRVPAPDTPQASHSDSHDAYASYAPAQGGLQYRSYAYEDEDTHAQSREAEVRISRTRPTVDAQSHAAEPHQESYLPDHPSPYGSAPSS
ncbi:hypothetical protein CYLTODRAFT_485962 [Cylindrobasidium torrendii FP15055 ss-10]|uniref:GATA-type domain-containing protein n=1 Tax=Cylindrobasidium torrendii FP15055 ss-10 TaxID=1314674 RepID=A0A0D7BS41_9AGAR|nr:hypothetical protein CYLTODRAFT_485962 [Cylindrobasidium torrendii FP15055 ss-10]